ncbi:MAG: cell pole-organizing protein PopZ [Dasania sp.]
MNNLANGSITKPKSDDMSMDEILASIRKIIASDEEKNMLHEAPRNNVHAQEVLQKQAVSISAREQLASLTQSNFDDSDDNRQEKRPTYQKITPQASQASQASRNNQVQDNKIIDDKKNSQEHDDEILRALNEIRENLSTAYSHSNSTSQANGTSQIQKNQSINRQTDIKLQQNHNEDENDYDLEISNINNSNVINNLDLKPVQFSPDAVPKFLKKFKDQQDNERTNNAKVKKSTNYDFSSMPKFDEPDEVMTLTDKVMPTTREHLKAQEQTLESELNSLSRKYDDDDATEKNVSRLLQGTEEIMRRATQRNVETNDDIIDDPNLNSRNSPMTALIMRTLKPMLEEWIEKNMQSIAEEVLRDEFRRGLK